MTRTKYVDIGGFNQTTYDLPCGYKITGKKIKVNLLIKLHLKKCTCISIQELNKIEPIVLVQKNDFSTFLK